MEKHIIGENGIGDRFGADKRENSAGRNVPHFQILMRNQGCYDILKCELKGFIKQEVLYRRYLTKHSSCLKA